MEVPKKEYATLEEYNNLENLSEKKRLKKLLSDEDKKLVSKITNAIDCKKYYEKNKERLVLASKKIVRCLLCDYVTEAGNMSTHRKSIAHRNNCGENVTRKVRATPVYQPKEPDDVEIIKLKKINKTLRVHRTAIEKAKFAIESKKEDLDKKNLDQIAKIKLLLVNFN